MAAEPPLAAGMKQTRVKYVAAQPAQSGLLACTSALLELSWRDFQRAADRMQLRALCRETTALQRKLEGMSGQIGGFGLAAALLSLAAMSGQFTWAEFVVGQHAWSWDVLPRYLHFIITAITIVVCCACCAASHMRKGSPHTPYVVHTKFSSSDNITLSGF